MEETAKEISEWLPILWTAGVEQGVELDLVHGASSFVKQAMTSWVELTAGALLFRGSAPHELTSDGN